MVFLSRGGVLKNKVTTKGLEGIMRIDILGDFGGQHPSEKGGVENRV